MIKDSGERREFGTGAVRDIQEGKGRCDLMPLGVISDYIEAEGTIDYRIFDQIHKFKMSGDTVHLHLALMIFSRERGWNDPTMLLEVSKHFEEGAEKYGEYNWQKGIPIRYYVDSAIRHYLKHIAKWTDEPHDRAFCWNILCCIWTCKNKPELDDFTVKGSVTHD